MDFQILLQKFSARIRVWTYFNIINRVSTEKIRQAVKLWHSNHCKQSILIPKLKKDERYSKFFQNHHVDIGPGDRRNRL